MYHYVPTEEDVNNPCKACNIVYDGNQNMVYCDECKFWFHVRCEGNPKTRKNQKYICKACTGNKGSVSDEYNKMKKIVEELQQTVIKQQKKMTELQEENRRINNKLEQEKNVLMKAGSSKSQDLNSSDSDSDDYEEVNSNRRKMIK